MSDDTARWLERLGLGQYAEAFSENAILPEHLPELDHDTLKEIGVAAVGHRITILKAAKEGTALDPPAASTADAAVPGRTAARDAERRQLSVMFCDLVGSTALSERLELESYRELLVAYQDAARAAVEAYDGYIARYMGDGLLVYFGYPTAHEDDAERAARAGLKVIDNVSAIEPVSDVALQVRVGIATGLVLAGDIVGEGASEERSVLGETPNLAARLQALATPDSVIIAEGTRRLIEGRFEFEALGPRMVKGLSEPVPAFRVLGVRDTSRFEAATAHGVSSFVGRGSELQLLLDRWARAREGEGQVVLLSGEAGIGKSRLLQELRDMTADTDRSEMLLQCSPFGARTAFFPIIEYLKRSAGLKGDETPDARLDKLEETFVPVMGDAAGAMPLLAGLLALPCERYPTPPATPQRQKIEIIKLLSRYIGALTRRRPLLLLAEDVHWIDPSTLDVFDAVVEELQTLGAMLVVTHRPGFGHTWETHGHVTICSLNRLKPGDGRSLSSEVAGGRQLPEVVLKQILEHTDGVPLFIEELTKTVIEGGLMREEDGRYVLNGPLPSLAIPQTLQDSLMARLDRLAAVKEVAQAAACIGREFDATLLAQVLPRPSLDADLRQLLDSGLIFRKGGGDEQTFIFKHALVQDTARESLLVSKRKQLHARIAAVLEDSPEPDPAILARHFSAAGSKTKAAGYFLVAGQRAMTVSALSEAMSELEIGLKDAMDLPHSPERERLELDLRMALGAARLPFHGWPHSAVASAFEPAFASAEKLDDVRALCCILWGLCVHYWTRAEFPQTHFWLDRLAAVTERSTSSELSVVNDMTAGCQYFWEADYDRAWAHTAHILETYDEVQHSSIVTYTNHDPLTFSLHWAGSLLRWILGYPDHGLELALRSHELARRINHPFNSAFALTAGSECLLLRGDTERVLRCCDEVQKIIDETAMGGEAALGDFTQHVLVDNWRGRTLTRMQDYEDGYRLTRLATSRWRKAEGKICSALFWGGEAMALGGLGRTQEALSLIDAAIDHCRTTGDRFMEPEVLRIKAELLIAHDRSLSHSATEILEESLQVARKHKAKSWELRSATSLARQLRSRGLQSEAKELLSPVYQWFTEGFDTGDLQEARSLLQDLS